MVCLTKAFADELERFEIKKQVLNLMLGKKSRNNLLILASQQVKPANMPEKFWVLEHKLDGAMMVRPDKGKDYLLVFSKKSKARKFLENINRRLKDYRPIDFCWNDLVLCFQDEFQFVALDDLGVGENVRVLILTKM